MGENTKDVIVIKTTNSANAVSEWFEQFGRCVASVNYQAARSIYAEDVVSFGTKAEIVSGIDLLQKNQWEGIWPNIRDFKYDMEQIHSSGDGTFACGITTWRSTGFDENGKSFLRPGRVTMFLENRVGRWLAVHTHHSLFPGIPQRTFGPKR